MEKTIVSISTAPRDWGNWNNKNEWRKCISNTRKNI